MICGSSENACRRMVEKLKEKVGEITSNSLVVISMKLRGSFLVLFWDGQGMGGRIAYLRSKVSDWVFWVFLGH